MSEENFLQFNNGNKFNFQDFKESIRIENIKDDELVKLFNIFDSDRNGVIENINSNNELHGLWKKLKNIAKQNNNSIIENQETENFFKKNFNINVDQKTLENFLNIVVLKKDNNQTITKTLETKNSNGEIIVKESSYSNGKPALVLGNIELKTKYPNNNKIRDAFLEYAKKLCAEIGQPDLPIYAGPNRHKLNMHIYKKNMHEMEIIGSTGDDEVYIDYDASPHQVGTGEKAKISMYQLR